MWCGVGHILIGQLSGRTETSRRLLRYYEEQGLIVSTRVANGYREYDEATVDRVLQIRGLLDAGLPTRIIKQLLPCLHKPRDIHSFVDAELTPETITQLEHERERMQQRINCLVRNRDAITEYLELVRDANATALPGDHADHADHQAAASA